MKKILYCVYTVFFTFIVWHVMFAIDGFDGAVKNSFTKGMEYPKQLAKQKELNLVFDGTPQHVIAGQPFDLVLNITGKEKHPVSGAEVAMEVARPASQQTAAKATAGEQDAGEYKMNVTVPGHGHWLVTAKIVIGGEKFTHEFRIYADKEAVQKT
jgi:nitrogen fixation protein FixH